MSLSDHTCHRRRSISQAREEKRGMRLLKKEMVWTMKTEDMMKKEMVWTMKTEDTMKKEMVWTMTTEDMMKKQGNAKRMTKAIIHASCGKI